MTYRDSNTMKHEVSLIRCFVASNLIIVIVNISDDNHSTDVTTTLFTSTNPKAVKMPSDMIFLSLPGRNRTIDEDMPSWTSGSTKETQAIICTHIPYSEAPSVFVNIGIIIRPRRLMIV
jgi:hypothetical protein